MDEAGKKSLINVAFLKQDSPRKSADRLLPKMIDSRGRRFFVCYKHDFIGLFVYNQRYGRRHYRENRFGRL